MSFKRDKDWGNNYMKKIMILGASILQLPAIQKARKMGLQVVVVDMNPEAIGFREDGVIKEVISTIDTLAVIETAKRHRIDGVMTLASDMPMQTVAAVAKEMGLVGIKNDTALKATNKVFMRKALREHNVPIPMFFRVSNRGEYLNAVKAIQEANCRCIVKPADNSGSRGINLLTDFERDTIENAYIYGKHFSGTGDLVVEEFMEGPEVSVETLSLNGVCYVIQITDKLTTGEPYFVEMGHSQPSQLPKEAKKKIEGVAIAANHAIGIDSGPSHTEIKVTKEGPKIVEIGARLGGDCITSHLVPLSTGVDMVECCIKIALGEKPDIKKRFNKAAAIRYFDVNYGTIRDIRGIEEAKKVSGIKQINVNLGVGEEVKTIQSSVDRVGFVISGADCVEKAIGIAEKAMNKVTFVVT